VQLEEEDKIVKHRQIIVAKHAELESCIKSQLEYLTAEFAWAVDIIPSQNEVLDVSPRDGTDAALGIAFLKANQNLKGKSPENMEDVDRIKLKAVVRSFAAERKWLLRTALAAKVMALVEGSTQKKLLNLCYDWLLTFLPHVLAKVNRVSFGLLSAADCAAAIQANPNVPRSRLKLCVPFLGKDVPSKSSEFAQPDVIIGLTILAYRYSGMRYEDFVCLIDALVAEFLEEIGPARERSSSRRHEAWVLAAGGRIRGLSKNNNDETGNDDSHGLEVVQLKFLQKSNKDQMVKLFRLLRREPLAIHYYLSKFIFPMYMLSQKIKLSASGQAIGGDMLVGRRVGFSGTPSDLLPKEMGRCDYATGDDGKILVTILDPKISTYEFLPDDWTVPLILERISTCKSPRYHALIDTGALIIGYSNQEVAAQLLATGLDWCDGVVFLDDNDEKQVLVRSTRRPVPADQCGVPLDRRFAFYDQVHTTGMDIKHVVNATAVITLGKDMVFRDFVQGAYRMRGIGAGQRIHLFIIPEVHNLIQREFQAAVEGSACEESGSNVLESVVAWLVINSMRTEQTQWSMLCVQNISNIYRKNAFARIATSVAEFSDESITDEVSNDRVVSDVSQLPLRKSLKVFEESIDFSLEASVPDRVSFESKLRTMLDSNKEFILTPEQYDIGHQILCEVALFASVSESGNLETEQEREQEQEQEKDISVHKEQEVEVEKFVEREYRFVTFMPHSCCAFELVLMWITWSQHNTT
jgi:hypothetical protein